MNEIGHSPQSRSGDTMLKRKTDPLHEKLMRFQNIKFGHKSNAPLPTAFREIEELQAELKQAQEYNRIIDGHKLELHLSMTRANKKIKEQDTLIQSFALKITNQEFKIIDLELVIEQMKQNICEYCLCKLEHQSGCQCCNDEVMG